jgi:3-hydroxybutyryl-CoA dehydratase
MESNDLFFEDYEVGEQGETCGRTVTGADVLQFASITGDFAPAHMDAHFMAGGTPGVRVGHGFLSTCLATGMLSYYAPHIVGRDTPTVCWWDMESRYPKPVLLEDTLRLQWSILEKIPDLNQTGFGTVRTAYRLIDQRDEIACDGVLSTKVRMRQAEKAKIKYAPGVPFDFTEFIPDFDKIYAMEDLVVGEGCESYGRMLTETDVVNLMELTQDYSRLYVDSAYAQKTVYGSTIVPWMLVAIMAIVLAGRDGPYFKIKRLNAPYIGHLSEKISFLAPAIIGDVIHCRLRCDASRASKTKPDRGIVTFLQQAINQRNEVLMEMQTLMMMPTRAAAAQLHETMWVFSTTKSAKKSAK